MIKVLIFCFKLAVTFIFIPLIGISCVLLSLLLWDSRFIDEIDKIQNDFIWGKK